MPMGDHYIPAREQDVPWSGLSGLEMISRLAHRATGGDPWVATIYDKRSYRAPEPAAELASGDYPEEQYDPGAPDVATPDYSSRDDVAGFPPWPRGRAGLAEQPRPRARINGGIVPDEDTDFDPRVMDSSGGPSARGGLEVMAAQSEPPEFTPERETPPGPARRATPAYQGTIEKMLSADVEPKDFWRALAKAGFTLAAQNTDALTALGTAGLAGIEAIEKAQDSARARQARGVGFAIQDATAAEQERRNATTEGETARSHRAGEARARDHVSIARGNVARAEKQLGFEMAKYKEGRGDARALTLARIQASNAAVEFRKAQARNLDTYGPSYAKPMEDIDAEGHRVLIDRYTGVATYATDDEGNKIKVGAKPSSKGAPTSMKERIAARIEEKDGKDEALRWLRGEKPMTAAEMERIANAEINSMQKTPEGMGWGPDKVRQERNKILEELRASGVTAKPVAPAPAAKTGDAPATPKTKADYDALPSGALYIDPHTGDTKKKK